MAQKMYRYVRSEPRQVCLLPGNTYGVPGTQETLGRSLEKCGLSSPRPEASVLPPIGITHLQSISAQGSPHRSPLCKVLTQSHSLTPCICPSGRERRGSLFLSPGGDMPRHKRAKLPLGGRHRSGPTPNAALSRCPPTPPRGHRYAKHTQPLGTLHWAMAQ